MNCRLLVCLGLANFIAQPAFAQSAPTSVQASYDSLAAAGYEVKAVSIMSDAAIKEVFAGQNLSSQVFVTLQKRKSVAVCEFSTVSWLTLDGSTLGGDATRCWKR